jgi:exodeoxyribonuclease (lambda-induced)
MIIQVEQNTDAWFEARLGKLTASDASTIKTAGKGLETLVYEKVAETLTKKFKQAFVNEAMEKGHELEMEARNSYEITTGKMVKTTGFWVLDEMEDVGASPDGLVGEDGLIEIKCPTPPVYAKYLYDGKIDPKYIAQMQMQMWVTNKKWVDFVTYNPDFDTAAPIIKVVRDQKMIDEIVEGAIIGITQLRTILEKIK